MNQEVLMEYRTKNRLYSIVKVQPDKKRTSCREVDMIIVGGRTRSIYVGLPKVVRLVYDEYGTVVTLDDVKVSKIPAELLDGIYTLFMNTDL